jgi:pilus assembly protein Flp/PilA
VKKLVARLRALRLRRDDGASAVEYGLLVALIAVIIAGTVAALGGALRDKFTDVSDCVAAAADCEEAPAPPGP